MTKIASWLMASAVVMFVLPWLVVTFIRGEGGMAACLILFYAVDPVYSIIVGAFAGSHEKPRWFLPIASAVFFLAGAWAFFDMGETAFILYAAVYLFLGIVAMLISTFIKKKVRK